MAAAEAAQAEKLSVALVEQPYRVAGRRSPAPARQLDAAWIAVVDASAGQDAEGAAARHRRALLGRPGGLPDRRRHRRGRRAVPGLPASPAGPPERHGQDELDGVIRARARRPGRERPVRHAGAAGPSRTVVTVAGNHSLRSDLEAVRTAVQGLARPDTSEPACANGSATVARARWRRPTRSPRSTPPARSASTWSSSTCAPGTASSSSPTPSCTPAAAETSACTTRSRTSRPALQRRRAERRRQARRLRGGAARVACATPALLDRTLISSQVPGVLDRVRALEPRARVGISVGGRLARFSRRWRDWRAVALAGLHSRRWDALMAQHRLVDDALLDDVSERGGRLYAWTVNERAAIARLRELGVHGITTADPRLFGLVAYTAALGAMTVNRSSWNRAPPDRGACSPSRSRPGLADCAPTGRIRLDALARFAQDIAYADCRRRRAVADARCGWSGARACGSSASRASASRSRWPRSAAASGGCGPSGAPRSRPRRGGRRGRGRLAVGPPGPGERAADAAARGGDRDVGRVDRRPDGDRAPSPPRARRRADGFPWWFRGTECDLAGHINNAAYLSRSRRSCWCEDAEPESIDVEIEYRSPAQPGEKPCSATAPAAGSSAPRARRTRR